MAGLNRCSAIGFVVALCASVSVHPSAAASSKTTEDVAFYLQGTCLCDVTPTAQEALGLAGGYLKSTGAITGIGYPAGLLFGADAVIGSAKVDATLSTVPKGSAVTLAGVSQGAIVLNYVKLARSLLDSLGRRAPDNLQFVTFGDPQNSTGGITTKNPALQLFAPNVPLASRYPTTEIVREYDGFSDWPDKPTRLAVLNAVMGIGYVHPDYGSPANPMTPGTLATVRTNAAGGTTTHYVVRTAGLPLTQPLRDMGLNTSLIDALLRPQIDGAYTRRPQIAPRDATTPPQRKAPDLRPPVIVALASKALGKPTQAPRQSTETSTAKDTTTVPTAKPVGGAKESGSAKESAGAKESGSAKEGKEKAPKPQRGFGFQKSRRGGE